MLITNALIKQKITGAHYTNAQKCLCSLELLDRRQEFAEHDQKARVKNFAVGKNVRKIGQAKIL